MLYPVTVHNTVLRFSVAEVEQCWMAYLAHKFAQVAGPALLCFNIVAYAVF